MLDPDHPDVGPSPNCLPGQCNEFNRPAGQPVHFAMRRIDQSQFSPLPWAEVNLVYDFAQVWFGGKLQVQRRSRLRRFFDIVISARAGKG
jgi:hypothetical protein